MKELQEIQQELKAPKNQFNSFGKYKYRSLEDVLEAVKPLLKEKECTLLLTDEVKEAGGIVYVESIAELISKDGATSSGIAQAGIEKTGGMQLAQAFGSASSYARKYALNGLFLIDDTKDADASNEHETTPKAEPKKPTKQPLTDEAKEKIIKAVFEGKGTIEQAKGKYDISERQEEAIKTKIQSLIDLEDGKE